MVKQGYKPTEIGVIPEDWEVVKLSESVELRKEKINPITSQTIYRCIELENIVPETGRIIGEIYTNEVVSLKTKFYRNDVLFGKLRPYLRKYAHPNFDGVCTSEIWVLHSKFINHKYLFYVFQTDKLIELANQSTGTKMPRAEWSVVSNLQIPLPPLAEQEAIASALSDADAWIDSLEQLIAKKRLIKQGAMQTLLTPQEDWEVKKLGEVGKCLRGVSYSGDSDLYESENENSIKLLRSNNVYNSKVVFSNIQNVNKAKVKEHQIIQKSDILICMANGSKELVGKAGFCNQTFDSEKYTFGAFMGIFRITENVNPYFIYLNFLSKNYRNFIDLLLSGSSINNLKPSDIEQIEIKIPSLSEQERIATILSDMDADLEALETQLGKARQIKQGMMQELLTGRTRLV